MSTVRHFDSIGEFLAEMERPEYAQTRAACASDSHWSGASTLAGAVSITREGVKGTEGDVAALIERINVNLPTFERVWEPSIAGPFPIVPAAIAGLPDCMLSVTEQQTTGVPLRIFVSVCLSGGCSGYVIRKRGIAINALLQTISARRPVELCIYGDMGDSDMGLTTPVIRVQALPLDQATLTAALTHPAFMRKLCFAWAEHHVNWGGRWAHGMEPTSTQAQRLTREALGARPDDLVIFGAYLSESDEIIRSPETWVQRQVELTEKLAKGETV